MAKASGGWVNTTKNDRVQEFWTANNLKRQLYANKVQALPSLNMHYEAPPSPTDKKWSDQSLLSTKNVNSYLAESDAFQRVSFANIVQKWKKHNINKNDQLISSFDDRYNMKIRFRRDDKLNRSSEMKYASVADYYRFLGEENNSKTDKQCIRYKRRIQEYDERHVRELLKLPEPTKSRSLPYFISRLSKLPSIKPKDDNSLSVRSFVSIDEDLNNTIG